MFVTMVDIARELEISQSTVSRVLNGKDYCRVSQEKAELIRKTAREMGYQVNLAAVGLRKRQSYAIGALLPSPRDSFYGELAAELQELLRPTEYIATFAFWKTLDEAEKATRQILSRHPAAVITCEPGFLPDGLTIPVVSYYNSDERFDFIGYDHEAVVRSCVDYLRELGHRDIAYIGGACKGSLRCLAFPQAMRDAGLPNGESSWEEGRSPEEGFERLWAGERRPTAILAHNDSAAFRVIRRAWQRGVCVPDDLSVIGFDDIPQCAVYIPALTTVRSTVSTAELLLGSVFARLADSGLPRQCRIVKSELVRRESCAPLKTMSRRDAK